MNEISNTISAEDIPVTGDSEKERQLAEEEDALGIYRSIIPTEVKYGILIG